MRQINRIAPRRPFHSLLSLWGVHPLYFTRRPYADQFPTFTPPRSNTHEGLAYVRCPKCSQLLHVLDMLTHMTSAHKEVSAAHCRALCEERAALYEERLGTPLVREERSKGDSTWDALPTVTAAGYECNWCEQRVLCRTRDDFLRHVIKVHPQLDLDEVESRVGNKPQRSAPSEAAPRPTRRLPGVMTVPESPSKPLRNREQRRGVTIPKYPSESPIVAMGTSTGGTLEFREGHFPCELCGKCYPSELILLQHLEGHLDPAKKEVSQYHREKAAAEGAQTQSFALVCDLCPVSKKVYNLPSSLFAHIRFKHPAEDASYHVDRLVKKCKSTEAFPCALCGKVFPTAAALESHTVGKHKETNNPVVPGEQWWCNLCEKGFLTSSALLSHLSSKHRQPLERFPCPACKRVFSDRFSLRAHISQSHAELDVPEVISATEIRCNKCNKLFLDHQGLHDHEVRHHHKDPRLPAKSFEGASIVRQAVVRQLKRSGAKKEEKPQP